MLLRDFVTFYQQGLDSYYRELSLEKLQQALDLIAQAHPQGRKVFFLGNGGSASHTSCDFRKGTACPGIPRLRVIALTDDMPLITAWLNHAEYDAIFKEQLENLLDSGDIVIGISTSRNSPNVLRAIEYAKQHHATTIGFIGFGGGKLKDMVHVDITVSSTDYGVVEDFHLCLNHILSQYFKRHTDVPHPLATGADAAV
jgi:D-sedoheptulose 7-phosphate isomerase